MYIMLEKLNCMINLKFLKILFVFKTYLVGNRKASFLVTFFLSLSLSLFPTQTEVLLFYFLYLLLLYFIVFLIVCNMFKLSLYLLKFMLVVNILNEF